VGREKQPAVSEHDAALLFTDRIVNTMCERRFTELQLVAAPFPPALCAGEVVLAGGGFELMTFPTVGDGGYLRSVDRRAAVGSWSDRPGGRSAGRSVSRQPQTTHGGGERHRASLGCRRSRWHVGVDPRLLSADHLRTLPVAVALDPGGGAGRAGAGACSRGVGSGAISWVIAS
jgi:hypothetical protein